VGEEARSGEGVVVGEQIDALEVKLASVRVKGFLAKRGKKIVPVSTYVRKGVLTAELPGGDPSGVSSGNGSKEDPFRTDNVDQAARLLGQGKYVELKHRREVSTLLTGLAKMVEDAKAKGEKAPTYDLCKVTVARTNLFCAQSKGIPRIKMPQLGGIPRPGSPASKFPKNDEGEVDLSEEFVKYLQGRGIKVTDSSIRPEYLKASQNELNGVKVAGIERAIESGKFDDSRAKLWVSNDDYVIDGHHRWAARVAYNVAKNKRAKIVTRQVDLPIINVLAIAEEWSVRMGIEPASVKSSGPKG
jgi:hypothetical protein